MTLITEFPVSATKMFPLESTLTDDGDENLADVPAPLTNPVPAAPAVVDTRP